jgi:hypothetical protein
MFEPIQILPMPLGTLWIEWFEALLSNGNLLVRCIPVPNQPLPEASSSVLLNFGSVIAFRASQDPFSLDTSPSPVELPRQNNGWITSQIMMSSSSEWCSQAMHVLGSNAHHFVLVSAQDQTLEILTETNLPSIQLESSSKSPNPFPASFSTS